ncbi:anti-CBASS protein Acb1 family protein [Citrobacter sp.]|uniref:anti-CBASS protein Acb1 family protein n=1 Tax=Citrobacter sp. TaxID=1896336 RepID=UPI002FC75336
MKLLHIMFPWFAKNQANNIDLDSVSRKLNGSADPLDVVSRGKDQAWDIREDGTKFEFRKASDFARAVINIDSDEGLTYVGDTKTIIEGTVMDSAGDCGNVQLTGLQDSAYTVPNSIAGWYVNQSFIGYQMCAILAQHWLVDKACSQSVEDAIRNGWTYKPDAGHKLTDAQKAAIDDFDVSIKLKESIMEAGRFTNIFGIRVLIFQMDSSKIPADYYSKPFNPDGIPEGAYQGISQIDPYWMTPMMTDGSMQNPASIGFYDPDYWIINGKRYHKSHLVILRGPQPADILKPTYIFGGIPLVQRIYERVYAAERTANEAPLLAMNKRTTAIHTDLDKVAANEAGFVQRLLLWIKYRDNHAVKVLGKEETMEQFDTSLSDFDSVIMNQYQLVAAIAKTPATKILGTSPKGFNATGEFETVSYHEELESIQERWGTPILDRHYLCLTRSKGFGFGLNVNWEPVDAMTAEKQAEINSKKVQDAVALATAGMISPDEGRDKLINDKDSGWNNLDKNEDADQDVGETPENIVEMIKAGAEQEKAGAEQEKGQAAQTKAGITAGQEQDSDPYKPKQLPAAVPTIDLILNKLQQIETAMMGDGFDSLPHPARSVYGIKGSTVGMDATTQGIGSIVPALPENKMPRVKVGGMLCCIENPRHSIRTGVGLDGVWQVKMPHHYGYIKGTTGADGEGIDCFIGPNPKAGQAFIVNQNDPNTGEFDEHKVMMGFDSLEEAQQGYMDSFSDGWQGFGSIHPIAVDALRSWVNEPRQEAYGSSE